MTQIVNNELEAINQVVNSGLAGNDTLYSGNLGLCYYLYNQYIVSENNEFKTKAGSILESIFEKINNGEPGIIGSSLASGGAGLAFVVNDLSAQNLIETEVEDEFADLEEFLFETAMSQIDTDFIDCIHGAFGIIYYFSERNSKQTQKYLELLVDKVCKKAIRDNGGIWFKNYVLQKADREEINFSLSHGLSGMLLILLNALDKVTNREVVTQTIWEGISFIRKHQLWVDFSEGNHSFYPFFVRDNHREAEALSRLAWCYGDLNQVLLFYRAANKFDDANLRRHADMIGLSSLMRRDKESTLVTDSHFCHGSSGVAHFYKILFRESGNKKYLDGYEYWIEKTLLLLKGDLQKGLYEGKEHAFLEGLVGVALTLLSYVSKKELTWSKAMFL